MDVKTIDIHGKPYVTVAERVKEAHAELNKLEITTEVLNNTPVVIKATVITSKGMFTGISAANPTKAIEKMSPYEVAETSAVGRALGFAGYGIVEGLATADEIVKADYTEKMDTLKKQIPDEVCTACGGVMKYKEGMKGNKFWCGYFCQKNSTHVSWGKKKVEEIPEVQVDLNGEEATLADKEIEKWT